MTLTQYRTSLLHLGRQYLLRVVGASLLTMIMAAIPGHAEDGDTAPLPPPSAVLSLSGEYVVDLVTVAQGANTGVRYVDLASLVAVLDLEAAAGWRGAHIVAEGIAGTGQRPNDLAGTLQGVNNNEVAENRAKIYQLYLEQRLARWPVLLRAGFIDLNAEFYNNDAAGLLIAPAFGIGSELAATGPNGPAIFPSTALTAAVRIEPSADTYTALAVVNAEAGVLGDAGGMRPVFDHGALMIGEIGWASMGKIALGAWMYTKKQDDIRLFDSVGDPLRQRAQGGYVLVEWPVGAPIALEKDAPRKASLFLRAGISDGDTTPYRGGWQTGILMNSVWPGRPSSQLSFGAHQALLADKFRHNEADGGNPQRRAETGLELTFADQVTPWLNLQADAQYVRNAGRGASVRDAIVVGLRFVFAFGQEW
ncbi:carbohydrate porin [Erythrobacter sp. R86502]|uniref:carbohydrate porin n=1 Tax=Erythrobacter sp. R86502 TaxID=3093846 RepID=UPI0036D3F957